MRTPALVQKNLKHITAFNNRNQMQSYCGLISMIKIDNRRLKGSCNPEIFPGLGEKRLGGLVSGLVCGLVSRLVSGLVEFTF